MQTPTLVLREADPEFWVGVGKTRSKAWLIIESGSKDTTEVLALPADQPETPLVCLHAREPGVEVSIDHRPGVFYRLHNQTGPTFSWICAPKAITPVAAADCASR